MESLRPFYHVTPAMKQQFVIPACLPAGRLPGNLSSNPMKEDAGQTGMTGPGDTFCRVNKIAGYFYDRVFAIDKYKRKI
jgi:hypothetical protein